MEVDWVVAVYGCVALVISWAFGAVLGYGWGIKDSRPVKAVKQHDDCLEGRVNPEWMYRKIDENVFRDEYAEKPC